MSTVEKRARPKQRRHQQTARDFERWLAKNPKASLKRKTEAFNAIADSNFKKTRSRVKKNK